MLVRSRSDLVFLLLHFKLPRIVVEVGAAECRFSKEMLNTWQLKELHVIDIWEQMPFIEGCASFPQSWHDDNYQSALELESGSNGIVKIHKGFSHKIVNDFPDEYFSLVYIDADHTYSGCKTDINCWWSKLCKGGIMAFHDFKNPDYGVGRAVYEFAAKNGIQVNEIPEDFKIENIGAWIQKI